MDHSPQFLKLASDARANVTEVTIQQVRAMQQAGEKFEFIDCREDNEWIAGRAAGAQHLGKGIIERDIETKVPDKDTKLVLYCGGGFRSALVADNLRQMGYTNAISLDGGWRALKDSGLALEK